MSESISTAKKADKAARALNRLRLGNRPYVCPEASAPLDLEAGGGALDFLRARSAEDPFFAALTLAFHSGPFPYSEHQMALEESLAAGPEALLTEEDAKKTVCGRGLTGAGQRARLVPFVARKYIEHCGADGSRCRTPEAFEKLLTAVRQKGLDGDKKLGLVGERDAIVLAPNETLCPEDRPVSKPVYIGMGGKIRELVREYVGDPNGVALDRHVTRWLCEDEGVVDQGNEARKACVNAITKKGKPVRCKGDVKFTTNSEFGGSYAVLKKAFLKKAKQKGVTPAHLQVSAWWARVCGNSMAVWLGTKKKLTSSEPGTAKCEVARTFDETCSESMEKLSSDDGTMRFCSPERKAKACAIWAKSSGNVKPPLAKVKRQKQGKLDGIFDSNASCSIKSKRAVDKMVSDGVLG